MGFGPPAPAGGSSTSSTSRLTPFALAVCAVAASGGLLFGYDLGVTGGVTQMPAFLDHFFPGIEPEHSTSPWCTFADPHLQLFTSSLFLAAIISTLAAGVASAWVGRRRTMLAAGLCFLAGVGLCAGAATLGMLVGGRVLLGLAVGLANQCVPLYLSEMAPPQLRGALNILFQLSTTFGLLAAQLVNLGTARLGAWGWRLSLGLAAVPALALSAGALLLPETPASLAERGREGEARRVLQRLRGRGADVEFELADIVRAAKQEGAAPRSLLAPYRQLFSLAHLPELVCGSAVAALSQASGINAILFYTPAVFSSLQLGQQAALLSAVVIGGTLFLGTVVALALVDRVGRRPLLVQGACQMLLALAGMAAVLGVVSARWQAGGGGAAAGALLSTGAAEALLVLMSVFVAGFSWSWGPLGWLVPSECCALPSVRSAGQAVFTAVNFAVAFASTQTFFTLLCALTWRIYVFFAGWVALAAAWALLLPEMRGVPVDRVGELWAAHWLWGRVVRRAAGAGGGGGGGCCGLGADVP